MMDDAKRINTAAEATRLIKRHEGYSSHLYRCPRGKLTIGYGYNIDDRGLPRDICDMLLDRDVADIIRRLSEFDWFRRLSIYSAAAIVDMAYQLGVSGLLQFRKTLKLLQDGRYNEAATEMLNSGWAKQTPARAAEIASIIARE